MIAASATFILPWAFGVDLKVAEPAAAMGAFFADNFQRRTGQPLAIVTGDSRTAALVALAAPSRPSVYFDAERSPWISADDIGEKGAIVVWPTTDTAGTPPPDIKARFPDLVPEVPPYVRAPGAGPAAAGAHRLGGDPAAQRASGAASHADSRAASRAASRAIDQ